jgi:hypothetical protein
VDVRERNVDTFLESGYQRLADGMSEHEDLTTEKVYVARGGKGGALARRGAGHQEIESRMGRMAITRVKKVDLPSLDSGIQLPWNIRSSKNQYSRIIITNTVDLSSAPVLVSPQE